MMNVCRNIYRRKTVRQFLILYRKRSDVKLNSSSSIRQTFLDYFCKGKDHLLVPSSSVCLPDDSSLFFVNAGMNQFKPIFLGTVDPQSPMSSYKRVANSQKCIRTGGKHNDLEAVGSDGSHHTFFEMLGNWSFADYFKEEACTMAWELLTQHYGLSKDKLYVTYFAGDPKTGLAADEECKNIWLSLGVSPERILPFGTKDNFWDMGDTGPCGPCTEIHYDHAGPRLAPHLVNAGLPDVCEVWNLVFTQYDRLRDGTLRPLPSKHVDTGMGLERLTAVLQGTQSNYDTDLFRPLFTKIHEKSSVRPYSGLMGASDSDGIDCAYRIVADHARMYTVSITDGVLPTTIGSGKIVRHMLRRAALLAKTKLRVSPGLLSDLVPVVVDGLGTAHPELKHNASKVKDIVNEEEERILKQLNKGLKHFQEVITSGKGNTVTGEHLYNLNVHYAFPEDLMFDLVKASGFISDLEGYHQKKEAVKNKTAEMIITSKDKLQKNQITLDDVNVLKGLRINETDDSHKYTSSENAGEPLHSKVLALKQDGSFVDRLTVGQSAVLVLDRTNFYAEEGGQSSDMGMIRSEGSTFQVVDVQTNRGYVEHHGQLVDGSLSVNENVSLQIDEARRNACMRSHTATHLLADVLRRSLPSSELLLFNSLPDKVRVDINTQKSLTWAQLDEIQRVINELINKDVVVQPEMVSHAEALTRSDMKISKEMQTHPDPMRVVSIVHSNYPWFHSIEACSGTHVTTTAAIGQVAIVRQKSVSQTVRSLTVLTGEDGRKTVEFGKQLESRFHALREKFFKLPPKEIDAENEFIQHVDKELRNMKMELDNNVMSCSTKQQLEGNLKHLEQNLKAALVKKKGKSSVN